MAKARIHTQRLIEDRSTRYTTARRVRMDTNLLNILNTVFEPGHKGQWGRAGEERHGFERQGGRLLAMDSRSS